MFKKLLLASVITATATAAHAVEFSTELSSCSGNTVTVGLSNANSWENNDLEYYVFTKDSNNEYKTKRQIIKPASDNSVRFGGMDDIVLFSVFSDDSRFSPRDTGVIFCNNL